MSGEASRGRRLEGRVALLTGAGGEIGRGIALCLAEEGAVVALADISLEGAGRCREEVEAIGGKAVALHLDVTDAASCEAAIGQTRSDLGGLDILVNNAGVIGGPDFKLGLPLSDISEADWDATYEVNVKGVFLLCRAALSGMVENKWGRIVNIVSEAGNNPEPELSAYSTSKAALIHFTDAMALAVADAGVRVFAYHPGMVRTGLADHLIANGNGAMGQRLKAAFAEGRDTPMERSAERLMFLASGRGDFLTGRYIMSRQTEEELLAQQAQIAASDLYKLRVNR